jgi:hypothetical protein
LPTFFLNEVFLKHWVENQKIIKQYCAYNLNFNKDLQHFIYHLIKLHLKCFPTKLRSRPT